MTKRFSRNYRSILKGIERAKKIKDLEVAKSLEINDIKEKNIPSKNPKKSTPNVRSDLAKE